MLSTLAIAAPPQATWAQDSFKAGDRPGLRLYSNTGYIHTRAPKASLSLLEMKNTFCKQIPSIAEAKAGSCLHNPVLPLHRAYHKPSSLPQAGNRTVTSIWKTTLNSWDAICPSASLKASGAPIKTWVGDDTLICILNRHSPSNSKFMQSPPRLEFEQLCFTNKSCIQQSSNHPGPASSCLVIHKAIASILKRIYRLFTFLTFIVFGN